MHEHWLWQMNHNSPANAEYGVPKFLGGPLNCIVYWTISIFVIIIILVCIIISLYSRIYSVYKYMYIRHVIVYVILLCDELLHQSHRDLRIQNGLFYFKMFCSQNIRLLVYKRTTRLSSSLVLILTTHYNYSCYLCTIHLVLLLYYLHLLCNKI